MAALTQSERVILAKVQMQSSHPFYSYMMLRFRFKSIQQMSDEEKKQHRIGDCHTMAVNAKGHLYYDEEFVARLKMAELKWALCHEVMHVILHHLGRGKRNWSHVLFNIANDIKVNDILQNDKALNEPDGVIKPKNHSWSEVMKSSSGKSYKLHVDNVDEKTSEAIYEELVKQIPPEERGGGIQLSLKGGNGNADFHLETSDGQEITQEELEKLGSDWKERVTEAATYARQRGTMPAGLERLLDEITESQLPWREYLMRFVTSQVPVDFRWSKPHKKSASIGFYMPDVLRESVEAVFHIDTSGSTYDYAADFLTEIGGVLSAFEHIKITLITCDAAIHDVYEMTNNDLPELKQTKLRGWGGTSHKPVVDYINEHLPETKIFVSLTDGQSDIEQCYNNLPESCSKLLVIPDRRCHEEKLNEFADIVYINN